MKARVLAVIVGIAAVALTAASLASADGYSITAMCTVGQGTAQPCSGGWYTTPVVLSWQWTPATSGSCTEESFDVDTNETVSCEVTWPSPGPTVIQPYTVEVELTSPTATVAPSRGADSNGWYNHPVAGAISATSFSGIASCTSTTYAGPNTTNATVSGTCTDNAGKTVTVTSAPFAYDATAPALTATATAGDQSVSLSWQTGGDIAPTTSIVVTRSGGSGDPVVYSGDGGGFQDTHLKNGAHYTYSITAEDAAGNATTRTVHATPDARLLSPAPNAHVTAPPALSWTAVPGATYYNVQLYRGEPTKLLSLWPAQAALQLHRTWKFDGRRYRLRPGRYKWYVWPGFGNRKAARYGHMIGSGTFVVVR